MKSFCLIVLLSLGMNGLTASEYYVSPAGSDANAGTISAPFATITKAQSVIRALKTGAGLPTGGVTVWLRAGYYNLATPLIFTSADSGTAADPITYSGFPGEQAFITGAVPISQSSFVLVNSSSPVWSRLDPSAQGKVYAVNLPALGITNYGTLKAGGFGLTATSPLELFCNGHPLNLARWPNIDQPLARTLSAPSATQITYSGTRPLRWSQAKDIWVHGLWNTTWADYELSVASVNTASSAINFASAPPLFGVGANQPYYAYNLLEEIDEPGEYYLDRTTGLLYLWPSVPMAASSFQVSMVESTLVQLNGTNSVMLRNITFEATRGPLLQIKAGSASGATGCLFRNSGQYAVQVTGTSNGLDQCEVVDSGEDGVMIGGGARATLTAGYNYITNSRVHRVGRLSWTYHPGVMLLDGCGNLVAHNLFDEMPSAAIFITGNDQVVEYNEISRVCQQTSDAGAIYSGRDWGYRGNVIEGNFIHHIQNSPEGSNTHGVFLDDLMSSAEVTNNIIYDVSGAGIACGGGRDNEMTNNIIAQCGIGHFNGDYSRSSVNNTSGDSFNLLQRLAADGIQYQSGIWATEYPTCAAIPNSFAAVEQGLWRNPQGCIFSNNAGWSNTSWTTELDQSGTGVFAVYAAMTNNNSDQAPLFTETESWDRSLRPEVLTAAVNGFAAIPFSSIGPSISSGSAIVLSPPVPVLQLLTLTNSQASMQWSDDGLHIQQQESGFEVQRQTGSAGTWQVIQSSGPDVDFATATGLAPSTTYSFRIRSFNAVGSVYSNVVTTQTAAPSLVLGTSAITPSTSPLTVITDEKINSTVGILPATTVATASVRMYDAGDAIQISFTTTAGLYQVGVRVRCGDTIYPTFYWPSGYQFSIDGVAVTMTGDSTTVSAFDPANGGFYWGTMNSAPMTFTAGVHKLKVTAESPWAAVNTLALTPLVPPQVATFVQWQHAHFTVDQLAASSIAGWSATPAGDSKMNLFKYALGLDPWTAIAGAGVTVSLVGGEPQLTYSRPAALTDLTYFVEVSNDQNTWTGVTQTVTGASGGFTSVKATQTGAAQSYIRLRIVCGAWTTTTGALSTSTSSTSDATTISTTAPSSTPPTVVFAGSPLTVVADVGVLGTIGTTKDSVINSNTVRLYDLGDAISMSIPSTAGTYVLSVVLRAGNLVSNSAYWPSGYKFTLDGSPITLTGIKSSISAADPSFGICYWGTMTSAPITLSEGSHTLVVTSEANWTLVNYAEIIPQ